MYESENDRTPHEADRCRRLGQEHIEKNMPSHASYDSWEGDDEFSDEGLKMLRKEDSNELNQI